MMPMRMPPNTPVSSVCRPRTALVSIPRAAAMTPRSPSSPGSRPSPPAPRRRRSWSCPSATPIAKIRPSAPKIGSPDALQDLQEDVEGLATMPGGDGSPTTTAGVAPGSGDGAPRRRCSTRRRLACSVIAQERAADAEQDAGHRQHRDRQHQRLAELLQEAEDAAPSLLSLLGRRPVRRRGCRGRLRFLRERRCGVRDRRRRPARARGPPRRIRGERAGGQLLALAPGTATGSAP